MVHEMLFVGPLVFQNKEPSYARMASSEGVRAAHAGSTPWSRTYVSYPGFIPCCLSRLGLVRVGYAHARSVGLCVSRTLRSLGLLQSLD